MLVTRMREWANVCQILSQQEYCSIDFETYGSKLREAEDLDKTALLLKRAKINIISAACPIGSWAIPLDTLHPRFKHMNTRQVLGYLRPVLESPHIIKAFHNANYDVNVALNHGIITNNFVCTMLAAAVQDANIPKGLKERALQVGMFLHKMHTLKDVEELLAYADEDALATLRLYEAYMHGKINDQEQACTPVEEIEKLKLQKWQTYFFFHQEMPVLEINIKAERKGMLIDFDYLADLEVRLNDVKNETTAAIYREASQPFDLNSNPQLCKFLYEDLKLPCTTYTPGNKPSVNKEALFFLQKAHPVIPQILKVRMIDKLLGTYVNTSSGMPAYAELDNRLHATVNTHAAVTGRFSVQLPALQTIPRESTIKEKLGDGFSLRRAFIASPGHVLLDFDFSQIELRLIAVFSEDPLLVGTLAQDGDLHQLTADHCKITRQQAKPVNFGLCYGLGPWKLAMDLTMSGSPTDEHEAKRIFNQYHETYPGVRDFHRAIVQEHKRYGYVQYLSGRRRSIPDIMLTGQSKGEKSLVSKATRELVNNTIQGSAADLIKQAMIRIDMDETVRKMRAEFIMSIHDELIFEVPEENAEDAKEHIRGLMEMLPEKLTRSMTVPIKADGNFGYTWADCK